MKTVAFAVSGLGLARAAASSSLLRFPYIQNLRKTRATVRWVTRQPGTGTLTFQGEDGQSGKLLSEVRAFLPAETGQSSAYYRHEVALTKLSQGTSYRYQIALNEEYLTAESLSFRTPGTASFQFLAFGDSGTGSAEQQAISRLLQQHRGTDFVLHTGDLVYPTGTWERYESLYFSYYRDLMQSLPFFPCPGNHDYYELKCIPYRAMFSLPEETVTAVDAGRYYSFDWGNAHFVSLDTNDCLEAAAAGSGAMLEWLDKDLSETTRFWRIVFFHHPAYSAGNHSDEYECDLVRKWIAPILDKHRIPLVLNGHEHSYQRTLPIRAGKVVPENEGTVYVTTGGGGAELHPVGSANFLKVGISEHNYVSCNVNGAKLDLRAENIAGSDLDAFTLLAAPIFKAESVVNAADFTRGIAPGTLACIFGLQLAPEDAIAPKAPLPRVLGGASVLIDGKATPLLLTSAKQLNFQIPFGVVGDCELTVRHPGGTQKVTIQVSNIAPAIFSNSLFHENDVPVSAALPAIPGEKLTLYATGLGELKATMEAGTAETSIAARASVYVSLGAGRLAAATATTVKGTPGVYAVEFLMPPFSSGEDLTISLIVNGQASLVPLSVAPVPSVDRVAAGTGA